VVCSHLSFSFFCFFFFLNIDFHKANQSTLPVSVEEWLKGINLECYWGKFHEYGFDRLDTLRDLDKEALKDFGVLLGHQGLILREISKMIL
jgi:hypothetical protein